MTTYLINHLRLSDGAPSAGGVVRLEHVETPSAPDADAWVVLDAPVEVLEGGWPRHAALMAFRDTDTEEVGPRPREHDEPCRRSDDDVISDLVLVNPVDPGLTSADWAQQIRTTTAAGAAAGP